MPVPGPTMIAGVLAFRSGGRKWLVWMNTGIHVRSRSLGKSARNRLPSPSRVRGRRWRPSAPPRQRDGSRPDALRRGGDRIQPLGSSRRETSPGRSATADQGTPAADRAGAGRRVPGRPSPRDKASRPRTSSSLKARVARNCMHSSSAARCRPCSAAPGAGAAPIRRTPPSPRHWRPGDRARLAQAAGSWR